MPTQRRSIRLLALALLLASTTSCLEVALVHRQERGASVEPIPGVPFYSKVDHCKEQTTFERRWSEVRLEVDRGGDGKVDYVPVTSTLIVVPDSGGLDQVRAALLGLAPPPTSTPEDLLARFDEFTAGAVRVDPSAAFDATIDTLVSRTRSVEALVDRTTVHYLNSRLPWFGSGKLDATLASDGTLSKAVAESESKAAEAVASFIPLKELLTAKWVPTAESAAAEEKAAAEQIKSKVMSADLKVLGSGAVEAQRSAIIEAWAEKVLPRTYRLVVAPGGWRWTRTRVWRADDDPACHCPPQDATLESLVRTPLEEAAAETEDAAAPKFRFRGEVALPEAKNGADEER